MFGSGRLHVSQPARKSGSKTKCLELFRRTRRQTEALVAPLTPDDMMLQSMEDASPAKWHLAHTTWFFEEFILKPYSGGYVSPDDRFSTLFNSYYVQAGPRHARGQRGLLSSPDIEAVMSYRAHIEDAIDALLHNQRGDANRVLDLVELGCHHEMQHQELLVTDLLHGLSHNPLLPVYHRAEPMQIVEEQPVRWLSHSGGISEIGHDGSGFAFDCEGPRHKTYLAPFKLASRPTSNREWVRFIEAGGYQRPELWLSDGWAQAQKEDWEAPLYWWKQDDQWWTYTLRGPQPVNLNGPVVHVSYYEADAYARFCGKRLPTEAEWETIARDTPITGNFLEDRHYRPLPSSGSDDHQFWGDVWEWTQSAFSPYPGFRPPEGAIGEYNGKFMCNQMVLRGGSCATPKAQMRPTYRTFFYPHQRWQMLGVRLADDE